MLAFFLAFFLAFLAASSSSSGENKGAPPLASPEVAEAGTSVSAMSWPCDRSSSFRAGMTLRRAWYWSRVREIP